MGVTRSLSRRIYFDFSCRSKDYILTFHECMIPSCFSAVEISDYQPLSTKRCSLSLTHVSFSSN